MSTKHTPRPWTLHPHATQDPPRIYHDGIIVATIDTSAPDAGERQANAALVAAAPDLFDACFSLLDLLKQYHAYGETMREIGRGPHIVDPWGATTDYMIGAAENVIAKARGES
jgi:hypothetical protein